MKILTDWMSGPPPSHGLWCVRGKGTRAGGLFMTTGPNDWEGTFGKSWEYRGLAFNPESAVEVLATKRNKVCLLIEEYSW